MLYGVYTKGNNQYEVYMQWFRGAGQDYVLTSGGEDELGTYSWLLTTRNDLAHGDVIEVGSELNSPNYLEIISRANDTTNAGGE